MVDLLDQFESVGLPQDGARRRLQQPLNPFDESEVGSLPAVRNLPNNMLSQTLVTL